MRKVQPGLWSFWPNYQGRSVYYCLLLRFTKLKLKSSELLRIPSSLLSEILSLQHCSVVIALMTAPGDKPAMTSHNQSASIENANFIFQLDQDNISTNTSILYCCWRRFVSFDKCYIVPVLSGDRSLCSRHCSSYKEFPI